MTAADPLPDELPDSPATAGKISDLERRRPEAVHARPVAVHAGPEAVHAASAAAVARQHAREKRTAWQRIEPLRDEASFAGFDGLARHRA